MTNVENSMQLCAECFAKRFGTASDSSSLENVERLVDVSDGSSTLANERTHLEFLSHGVGACGRRPSESADPSGPGVTVDLKGV